MERLQKVIAQAGIASRRKAEELIKDGKVKVNGEVKKELGTKVSESDKVEVNNKPIEKEKAASGAQSMSCLTMAAIPMQSPAA